ncbi:3-methylmercaptopropionyl-CoA dehydrogenase (DmdC) [Rhodococcus wratislaviensis]|uniref:3-methylmercaptopropionyl-CoA dehydrogenase (DmdC) n=1 Tax=Rhodococcus wratislaviensis TaxID=44752 RepID=A0A402CFZ8_RHOWR|nr:acyl-CoA dehydrogenase [Rhodococcus wratislaviensis]GCE42477.1 3-methylmercaptopropionyl-CoA dehydrogenase (DmdC) [Rhodococcus wratislaviensis]
MTTPPLSRRDLEFLLYEWLDVESLTTRARFQEHSRDTFDAVLALSADIATKHFAPHNKTADATEPTVGADGKVITIPETKKALEVFAQAGLFAGSFGEDLGGMQLPTSVMRASIAWFQAANAGTSGYPFLTVANANLLVAHASEDQIDAFVRPMLEGRFFGTMCLSEPQAGSSLADISTKAVEQEDGSYRLSGTKMWISGGDHEISDNIVHLVLAKIPGGPSGVKGISLFIVPKYLLDDAGNPGERNDVALVGLNHKMGNRGTTNALLNFGDGSYSPGGRPGAVGYLVGQPHHGLSYMFHMMNEARIGVGFLATALGYAGFLQSVDYAKTRTQGRNQSAMERSDKPIPIIAHADVKRMLLAQKSYVEGALALGLYCSKLVDEQDTADDTQVRDQKTLLLDVLTPIAKSWPSQWCLRANDLAIQVHGGYGYTRDYDVEQFYRDNRLNQIHEGTHGIQGLDLLGRKMSMQDGAGLEALVSTIQATVDRARHTGGEASDLAKSLDEATEQVRNITRSLLEAMDRAEALANSSIYLEAVGHVVIAWMWLEQFLVAASKEGDFYAGKRQAARYFFRYELPTTAAQFDLLATRDRTTLDMNPAWF